MMLPIIKQMLTSHYGKLLKLIKREIFQFKKRNQNQMKKLRLIIQKNLMYQKSMIEFQSTYRGYIEGAKSQAAKEYWMQKLIDNIEMYQDDWHRNPVAMGNYGNYSLLLGIFAP